MSFKPYLTLCALALLAACNPPLNPSEHTTPFERSDSVETATYEEGIRWWRNLEEASPYVCMQEAGSTDIGKPLHLVVINPARNFGREQITSSGKTIWLINNAIHPGEPDGVDASMLFVRDLLSSPDFEERYKDVVILVIPFYNVGGALNRNCCSRANQDGPTSYGFRGNARNLDLNRDFSKVDSKNAASFVQLFQRWDPDVYLETHVSNGADYPYTMTFLMSHPSKLTPPMDEAMEDLFSTPLFEAMRDAGDEMIPYVNVFGTSPDAGYQSFYDSPRYSTGFTALHHAFGMLTETHMLKPFKARVASTLRFMHALGDVVCHSGQQIQAARMAAQAADLNQSSYVLDWAVDTTESTPLLFKGYRAYYDSSNATGLPQLYYDRSVTWEHEIPYFNRLTPLQRIQAPKHYLLPRAWSEVVDRLKWNGVQMDLIHQDTSIVITSYNIDDYKTSPTPKEGHYYHQNTRVVTSAHTLQLRGDEYYLIPLEQKARRLIIEMLEPMGPDSYFNWNFFDEILQQKEWFSPYVFDPEATRMLDDPTHKAALDAFIAEDSSRAEDAMSQLYFLYQRSTHFERDRYLVYPVFRIE
jgi:hypothetical protein